MIEQSCGTCRHHHLNKPLASANDAAASAPKAKVEPGLCRRFPPQTHFIVVLRPVQSRLQPGQVEPREEQRSAFPRVLPDWTCAEWAPAIALTS